MQICGVFSQCMQVYFYLYDNLNSSGSPRPKAPCVGHILPSRVKDSKICEVIGIPLVTKYYKNQKQNQFSSR